MYFTISYCIYKCQPAPNDVRKHDLCFLLSFSPSAHKCFTLVNLYTCYSLIERFSLFLSPSFPLSLWLCQKSMRFSPDATVWVAKQQILCTLTQSLRDVLNYGLFQPAVDGRESGFLEEERPLRDYPLPSNKGVPTLEVTRRLACCLNVSEST